MRWQVTGVAAFVLLSALAGSPANAAGVPGNNESWRGVQFAGLFGESDAEKAARLQHEQNQDTQIGNLQQQVQDLEQSLEQVTGQNEQLSHRVQELSRRLDQEKKDFDYKICTLAAQQLGAGTNSGDTGGGLPCDTGGTVPAQAGAAQAGAPTQLQNSGGTLGTLPAGAATASPNQAQYDSALNLLAKAQYDNARAAFQSFADANPKDDLAPQALYWVGDIAYVQKDFAGAAKAFADVIKTYPKSDRAPHSMLKLGQSLLALGQKREGCLTLGAIKSKYRHAPEALLKQAIAIREASCR